MGDHDFDPEETASLAFLKSPLGVAFQAVCDTMPDPVSREEQAWFARQVLAVYNVLGFKREDIGAESVTMYNHLVRLTRFDGAVDHSTFIYGWVTDERAREILPELVEVKTRKGLPS